MIYKLTENDRLTVPLPIDEIVSSRYGKITNIQWLNYEVIRLKNDGFICDIRAVYASEINKENDDTVYKTNKNGRVVDGKNRLCKALYARKKMKRGRWQRSDKYNVGCLSVIAAGWLWAIGLMFFWII
jgi:hypothetical protein